jgi:hypothetical protein
MTDVTLTPAELRTLLDLLASAEVKLGVAYNLHPVLARAATLASGDRPIGGVEIRSGEPLPKLLPVDTPPPAGSGSRDAPNTPPWAE